MAGYRRVKDANLELMTSIWLGDRMTDFAFQCTPFSRTPAALQSFSNHHSSTVSLGTCVHRGKEIDKVRNKLAR
ncbi:uncharacterized protein YALI1_C14024g [Yarrowia lipolytica]|uniref:Uncharacterized protein n=1 Tax=Yarrowia lipolytica TaxID=4952 RepID=A0A1D8NAF4_YARLL|nr:hypothetical protein YALI1_C14024g [Yarrowia lipolytica]